MADAPKGPAPGGQPPRQSTNTPATQHLLDEGTVVNARAQTETPLPAPYAPPGPPARGGDTESHPVLSTGGANGVVGDKTLPAPSALDQPLPAPASNELLDLISSVPEDALEGQVVAVRYRVIRKIGEGGMGAVYLAEHVTIEKKVALKVLLHEFARKQVIKERFLQEAKAAAKIGHENIVDIIDFGHTPNGTLFFAMEYMEGKDLSDVVQMDGALPWSRLKPIMLQICRGMHAAHDKGIIHRDMKPENIFLISRHGQEDFVKILDFGIAKVSLGDEGGAKLTRTGMVFGTPQYMSPEQAQGKKPDNRVDIYSVGCIMYELLTGQVPFPGDSFMAILTKHISEEPRPMREVYKDAAWPPSVDLVVAKAMAKNPEHRFQSMADMAKHISRLPDTWMPGDEDPAPAVPLYEGGEGPQLEVTLDTDMETLAGGNRRTRNIILALGGAIIGVAALVMIILFSAEKDDPTDPGTPSPRVKPAGAAVDPAADPAKPESPDAGQPTPDLTPPVDLAVAQPPVAPKPKPKPRVKPRPRPRPRPKPKPVEPKPVAPKPVEPKPKPKNSQKVRDLLDPFQ